MSEERKRNSFRPGAGKMPPLLAGRQEEQKTLLNFLDRTRKYDSPDSDIVLIGPRGNGKTALLR